MLRRFFPAFTLVAVLLGLLVLTPCQARADDHVYFPQSVASGDPKPDNVVLWTRIDSPTEEEPKLLTMEVATNADFTDLVVQREVSAWAEYDYCTKVRVGALEPYTTYYYRFRYRDHVSPVGRTRTAPALDADQPVRFAVVYCQDYIGRYYNSYLKLLLDHDEDIDLVVHLGDYVYETTGDAAFQAEAGERIIEFDDIEGAIPLGDPDDPYYGAASLANYRTLYRTYRSDKILQQVHERWPMVVIWDDHEFSNDSWQAHATYTAGRSDELQEDRRRNAERAFFEWIPTSVGLDTAGLLAIDDAILYPNSKIYRDFELGAHLHLVLTDYRTYRPDHLIPEDAFPGAIALDEPTLRQALGETFDAIAANLDPYVDLDQLGLNILNNTASLIVLQLYRQERPDLDDFARVRLGEEKLSGKVSATYLNALYAAAGLPVPFSAEHLAAMPHGISYLYLGKQSLYSSTGSRYLVLNDTFNLFAEMMYGLTGGEAQNILGSQQEAWLYGKLSNSVATWKVMATSMSMAPMVIDFTNPDLAAMLPAEFPDVLRTRLKLNVDQWDGAPQKRAELLQLLATAGNGVVISGDIHACFVTDHNGVYEFTPPAVSSMTLGGMVAERIARNPMLAQVPGLDQLIAVLGMLLQRSALDDDHVSPSDLIYANTASHGFAVIDATADSFTVTIQEIAQEHISDSYYDDPDALQDLFQTTTYTIRDGQLSR